MSMQIRPAVCHFLSAYNVRLCVGMKDQRRLLLLAEGFKCVSHSAYSLQLSYQVPSMSKKLLLKLHVSSPDCNGAQELGPLEGKHAPALSSKRCKVSIGGRNGGCGRLLHPGQPVKVAQLPPEKKLQGQRDHAEQQAAAADGEVGDPQEVCAAAQPAGCAQDDVLPAAKAVGVVPAKGKFVL